MVRTPVLRRGRRDGCGRIVASAAEAEALFAPSFSQMGAEELRVAHLDGERCVVGISRRSQGDPGAVDLPVGEIIREAMALGSRAILLAHNHPSGDPEPSRADRLATRRLAEAAGLLGIRLLDHLVFAGRSCRSFRAMGLL
jgi:DNA repair protein RadC